jgi:hypothetical protein
MDNLVAVRLTAAQVRLVESIVAIPEELERALRSCFEEAEGTACRVPYEVLEQLAGWLAAEANREENGRRRESIDRVYDEIQTALWEFDDQRISRGEPVPIGAMAVIEGNEASGARRKRSARKA